LSWFSRICFESFPSTITSIFYPILSLVAFKRVFGWVEPWPLGHEAQLLHFTLFLLNTWFSPTLHWHSTEPLGHEAMTIIHLPLPTQILLQYSVLSLVAFKRAFGWVEPWPLGHEAQLLPFTLFLLNTWYSPIPHWHSTEPLGHEAMTIIHLPLPTQILLQYSVLSLLAFYRAFGWTESE
jgi:hypothetical protein